METVLLLAVLLSGGTCPLLALGVAGIAWSRARRAGRELEASVEAAGARQAAAAQQQAAADHRIGELTRERDQLDAELAAERGRRIALETSQADARRRQQSILEAQEAFLARMSHELRTPLNAVNGYCELLLEDAEGPARVDLERIRVAAANLGALVTSVLDLSELQSGDYALRPEVVRLDELVGRVVDASRFVADQQRDTLEVEVERELVVTVDRRMLSSILFHLVSNACKFTLKGTVRIAARSAQTELRGVPSDALEVVVSDTGIGMTPRQIEAAFQPFSQGDDSFTRRYDGGGVGLAVVNGFVQAMGGEVAITSVPGAGATVKVLLPKEVRPRNDFLGDDEDTVLLR